MLPITNFASESAGGNALGINGSAFLIQLVTFGLAFWVLKKFAFGPILSILAKRRETIEAGVSLGEEMRQERAMVAEKSEAALKAARAKADAIVADAEAAARDRVRASEEEAAKKAAIIVKEGQARGEQEVVRARKAFQGELVGLVSDATEAIIDEKVDAKKDAQLIDRALKGQKA
ncbi:F0F1 ATP synthase subunit B [Candidatus Saccharibacteria bacterium]|nr:F0F1 ATP synthase subunit B [Candidatus Saccharibacteria bacterium]HPG37276.1 F0F1 ATP synthase subunit B [Candidatus Saccharibacteria bacterium]